MTQFVQVVVVLEGVGLRHHPPPLLLVRLPHAHDFDGVVVSALVQTSRMFFQHRGPFDR